MIDRTGLTEQEINLIEHCVALEEQGLIDSDGVVVSGKETSLVLIILANVCKRFLLLMKLQVQIQ